MIVSHAASDLPLRKAIEQVPKSAQKWWCVGESIGEARSHSIQDWEGILAAKHSRYNQVAQQQSLWLYDIHILRSQYLFDTAD